VAGVFINRQYGKVKETRAVQSEPGVAWKNAGTRLKVEDL
jgi:hypothetical protein